MKLSHKPTSEPPDSSETQHKPAQRRKWLPLALALLALLVLIATVAVAAQRRNTAPTDHNHDSSKDDTAEPKSEKHTGYEEPPAE